MTIRYLPIQPNTAWQQDAACAEIGHDQFFPEKGESNRRAKRICRTLCGVRDDCLQYALETDQRYGVWGGLSERERRRLGGRTGVWSPNRITDGDAGVRKVAA